MDSLFALQTLLDSLLKCHNLMGWKVFPEKSGSILVNIRLIANKEALCDFDMADITACRKLRIISPKQMERNSDRAKRHSESLIHVSEKQTRTRKPPDLYTDPRNKIEKPRSNDLVHRSPISAMPSPDLGHVLNVTHSDSSPDALITCSSPSRSESTVCDSTCDRNSDEVSENQDDTTEGHSEMGADSHGDTPQKCHNASFVGEDSFRRPSPFVPSKIPPPIPVEFIEPEEHDDFYEIISSTNGRCNMGHCFYKKRSGPRGSPPFHDSYYDWTTTDIYVCDACQPDYSQTFCLSCINKGAHEPHRPWLRTF